MRVLSQRLVTAAMRRDDEYEEEYDSWDERPRRRSPFRVLLALVLLAGGVAVAMMFRKPAESPAQPPDEIAPVARSPHILLREAPPDGGYPAAATGHLTGSIDALSVGTPQPAPFRPANAHTSNDRGAGSTPGADGLDTSGVPPSMPRNYPRVRPRAADAWYADEIDGSTSVDTAERGLWASEPALAPGAAQRHTIRDGDTLSALADRYLDDAGRYLEIFEANRDTLTSPEVLPIGREIRIPSGDRDATGASVRPMVPVAPGALRREGARGGPQTYRVRPDDTLVDIARRFYGDGARYRELFEANRDQLRSPHELREGLLLVIP